MPSPLKHNFLMLGLAFLIGMCSCYSGSKKQEDNPIVARVGNYTLKKSDAIKNARLNASSDTARILESVIKTWVKEELFSQEAYREIGKDSIIQALVNDYKKNLIDHYYEKEIIRKRIDSTIDADEIQVYYENNKEQFILQSDIIRCQLLSIKRGHHLESEIKYFWDNIGKDQNRDSLIRLANDYANTFLLNDSTWYMKEDLESLLPSNVSIKSSNYAREERFRDDSLSYYLRILEQVPGTKVAPLSFIEKQANEVISHRRKRKILDDYKQQALQEALKTNKVEILN